jgi:hypothetical protein
MSGGVNCKLLRSVLPAGVLVNRLQPCVVASLAHPHPSSSRCPTRTHLKPQERPAVAAVDAASVQALQAAGSLQRHTSQASCMPCSDACTTVMMSRVHRSHDILPGHGMGTARHQPFLATSCGVRAPHQGRTCGTAVSWPAR